MRPRERALERAGPRIAAGWPPPGDSLEQSGERGGRARRWRWPHLPRQPSSPHLILRSSSAVAAAPLCKGRHGPPRGDGGAPAVCRSARFRRAAARTTSSQAAPAPDSPSGPGVPAFVPACSGWAAREAIRGGHRHPVKFNSFFKYISLGCYPKEYPKTPPADSRRQSILGSALSSQPESLQR